MITEKYLRQIHNDIKMEQEVWLRRCLEQILPPIVFKWASEGKNTEAIARYLDRRKIKLYCYSTKPNVTELRIGDTVFSVFEIRFNV